MALRQQIVIFLFLSAALGLGTSVVADQDVSITVRQVTGQYDEIVGHTLGDKPFFREPGWDDEDDVDTDESSVATCVADQEVPF